MNEKLIKTTFWCVWLMLVAICCYFIINNAAWLIGDDSQVFTYTGWDKPIFGFFVDPSVGRFFPLDYTLYDILCLFYDNRIGPMPHYFIHAICFVIFCAALVLISLRILKDVKPIYRYGTTLFLIITVIGRTYVNFIQLWTGIWTIYVFIVLFIFLAVKFFDTKNWWYGTFALLSINYVLYYYETMFTIPITIGFSALLFSYKKQEKSEKVFNWILIASGILFLVLYAVLVLPRVENMYHHYTDNSLLANAWKMFFAQKIMWVVVAFGLLRIYSFIRYKTLFTFYDGLLLASCAYCCGAAVLHLDYTLYYTPATLCALPASLYFSNEYFEEKWTILLFACLALFYGKKIPQHIKENQKARVETVQNINTINNYSDEQLYFYEPYNETLNEGDLVIRNCFHFYIKTLIAWYRNDKNLTIEKFTEFDGREGIWIVYDKDFETFVSTYSEVESMGVKIGSLSFFRVSSLGMKNNE